VKKTRSSGFSKGDLKAEIKNEIVAAQDQGLQTKYYATKILNTWWWWWWWGRHTEIVFAS